MAKDFDGETGMYRQVDKPVNFKKLGFVRYLVERGMLEHLPAGSPSGPFTEVQQSLEKTPNGS